MTGPASGAPASVGRPRLDPADRGTIGRVEMAAIAALAGRARLALPGACLVFGGFTLLAVSAGAVPPTSYAAAWSVARLVTDVTGAALLAAAAITTVVRPRGLVGPLTAAIGVAWWAWEWVGWEDGPPTARSVAMVVAPLLVPFVVHLVLAYPAGRVGGSRARVFLALGYGAACLTSAGLALFRDPFLDQHCWANCSDNVFLLRSDLDLARLLERSSLWVAAVVGVLGATAGAWRLARATPVARGSMWFVVGPGSLAAVASAGYAVLLLADPGEDPTATSFRAVFLVRAGTLLALAIGVTAGVWRVVRTERAVTRLADELGTAPAPGSFGPALARSLGDDGLAVAYWLPSSGRYVDASGQEVDPRPAPGQTSTAIVRGDQTVAVVLHDAALTPGNEIGPAARLAVDNERLRAEVLAQLRDLRASQARIVATADTTRRHLERDLHDGAQQRLLAASYELRLARSAAAAAGDVALADTLTAASEQSQYAITELRTLAHGIFPAILTESGLEPAVRSLADRAPLPVEVDDVVIRRYGPVVETAAYLVVGAAVEAARRGSATFAAVHIVEDDGHLVIDVYIDPEGPVTEVGVEVGDRVGALGGRLAVGAGSVRAEIPCAS
jgi:signal transduction histidine kinase